MCSHILDQDFLFATKTTTDARLDHPDALDGQIQNRGQDPPGVERHLGAGANHQPVVFIPIADDHMRFDMRLLNLGHLILVFEHKICFRKTLLNIPNVDTYLGCEVFGRIGIGKIYVFSFIMNDHRAGKHRLRESQGWLEFFRIPPRSISRLARR